MSGRRLVSCWNSGAPTPATVIAYPYAPCAILDRSIKIYSKNSSICICKFYTSCNPMVIIFNIRGSHYPILNRCSIYCSSIIDLPHQYISIYKQAYKAKNYRKYLFHHMRLNIKRKKPRILGFQPRRFYLLNASSKSACYCLLIASHAFEYFSSAGPTSMISSHLARNASSTRMNGIALYLSDNAS